MGKRAGAGGGLALKRSQAWTLVYLNTVLNAPRFRAENIIMLSNTA